MTDEERRSPGGPDIPVQAPGPSITDKNVHATGPGNVVPPERPYEVIAYMALGTVLLAQFMQGALFGGLLSCGCGLLGLKARLRRGPIFYLVLVAGTQLAQHGHGISPSNLFRPAWLDLGDILVCAGVLGFVAVHYRLQGIWFHHLAVDPRRRGPRAHGSWNHRAFRLTRKNRPASDASPASRRSPEHIGQQEIALLVISLPLWALIAQAAALGLPGRIDPGTLGHAQTDAWLEDDLPHGAPAGSHLKPGNRFIRAMNDVLRSMAPWLRRIVLVIWVLGLGTFVITNMLDLWKHARMSRPAAWIFFQDVLWRETRGEQRRIQRWLAWKRLRDM